MDQESIALPIAPSDRIVTGLRLLDQAGIRGAISAYLIRSTQWDARSRDWLVTRRRKNLARRSMSDELKVGRALIRFRATRVWKSIFAPLPKESCSGWMLSFVAR